MTGGRGGADNARHGLLWTRGVMGNALRLSFCVVRMVENKTNKNKQKKIDDDDDETFLKGGD